MKRILQLLVFGIVCACFTLFTGCGGPGGKSDWTVMSWNVQNLFDGKHDGNEYSEFDPARGDWNERLYLRRLERAGRVVLDAVPGGPDFLVLQEIEHEGVLVDLAEGPLRRAGYRWLLSAPGEGPIHCGVLSRYEILKTKVVECGYWKDRPLRPLLAVTVETPLGKVDVLALHWKSPWDGKEETEKARRCEASMVDAYIRGVLMNNPKADVMALGDLNTSGDGEMSPAALAPWSRDSDREKAVLYRTPQGDEAGLRNGKLVLFDPEPSSGPPGTYWFRGAWERPDRALLTGGFLDAIGPEFSSCRIAATAGDDGGRPLRWITDKEEGYSDHLPLILLFGGK